jgi:flagellar assembly factor FliW
VEINTRALGPIEIDESRVIQFVETLYGMEAGGDRYAMIDVNPESPVKLLQSVGNKHICFLVGDPNMFLPEYTVEVAPEQVEGLGLADESDAAVLVILTITGGVGVTANFKGPIVVNRKTFKARQVIAKKGDYSTKTPVNLATAK